MRIHECARRSRRHLRPQLDSTPAGDLRRALTAYKRENHAALSAADLPDFLTRLKTCEGDTRTLPTSNFASACFVTNSKTLRPAPIRLVQLILSAMLPRGEKSPILFLFTRRIGGALVRRLLVTRNKRSHGPHVREGATPLRAGNFLSSSG